MSPFPPGKVEVEFPGLKLIRTAWVEFHEVGTQAELAVAALNPEQAVGVRLYAELADEHSQAVKNSGKSSTEANAVKHAYWNALISSGYDSSLAAMFTTAHEYSNRFSGGYAFDSVMDLHNNAIGRLISDENPGANVGQLQVAIAAALASGRLWIIDSSTNEVMRSNGKRIYK